MHNFSYYDVKIERLKSSDKVIFKGEITNNSDKFYSAVAIRVIIFVKNQIAVNEVFTINGLRSDETKAFSRHVYDLLPGQTMDSVTRFEYFVETCY